MCMIDDAERYWPYTQTVATARKEHKCDECGRLIAAGEKYERMTGLLEGFWGTARTCAHCIWARGWLTSECNGFCHRGVYEDLLEHWQEEALLRDLDLGRRIVGMRRKWLGWNGELLQVPA